MLHYVTFGWNTRSIDIDLSNYFDLSIDLLTFIFGLVKEGVTFEYVDPSPFSELGPVSTPLFSR